MRLSHRADPACAFTHKTPNQTATCRATVLPVHLRLKTPGRPFYMQTRTQTDRQTEWKWEKGVGFIEKGRGVQDGRRACLSCTPRGTARRSAACLRAASNALIIHMRTAISRGRFRRHSHHCSRGHSYSRRSSRTSGSGRRWPRSSCSRRRQCSCKKSRQQQAGVGSCLRSNAGGLACKERQARGAAHARGALAANVDASVCPAIRLGALRGEKAQHTCVGWRRHLSKRMQAGRERCGGRRAAPQVGHPP